MTHVDEASRIIPAGRERVFAALLDRDALERWLPPEGMTGVFEHFDPRPGGGYRLILRYPEGAQTHGKSTPDSDVVEARFAAIVPGFHVTHEVRFVSDDPAFSGLMTMHWMLEEAPGGTRVQIRAEEVPDGITPAEHAVGLDASLRQLERHLSSAPDGPS